MENILERVKKINFDSSEKELDEVLNQLFKDYSAEMPEMGIEKIKLIYQIQEMRRQSKISRCLVFATWILVIATIIINVIN